MKMQGFGPEIGGRWAHLVEGCRDRNELRFDILYAPIWLTVQKLRLFEVNCSLRLFGPLFLLLRLLYILFCNLLCIRATLFFNGNGTVKVGSPKACVAAYKVCWYHTQDCFDADIIYSSLWSCNKWRCRCYFCGHHNWQRRTWSRDSRKCGTMDGNRCSQHNWSSIQ